jgi:hypothetical protein
MNQIPLPEKTTPINKPLKLLDQVVERLRVKQYRMRTEQAYVQD